MLVERRELRRHDWAWLGSEVDAASLSGDPGEREFLKEWIALDCPFVVARGSTATRVNLGVTRPGPGPRSRVGITVALSQLTRTMPPLSLEQVGSLVPHQWRGLVDGLRELSLDHQVDIRVYGSLALQYFSPWPCINPDSDLDILLELAPDQAEWPLLAALEVLQERHPHVRMDGEVRSGEWAVSWRELLQARRQRHLVLARSDQTVALRDPALSHATGRLAVRALYRELQLYPKPGLVSPGDRGAHEDMDARLFLRSLFGLRHYFVRMARAGANHASFAHLQHLGRQAEDLMQKATGGVNTHRGAIFHLGLLVAARGWWPHADPATLCAFVGHHWGKAIMADHQEPLDSHGHHMARRFGLGGARQQAASGFPVIMEHGLPAWKRVFLATGDVRRSSLEALFAMMAALDDTNLVWRGGLEGLHFVQGESARFLFQGGVLGSDWEARILHIHRQMKQRRLSPGGSADLLAALFFLMSLS